MKAKRFLTVFVSCFIIYHSAFGQGVLTPPGAPAPTMKSLDQIEARVPIVSAPFTISAPGSYYLTTNLTTAVSNAISIAANGVTLDLNGFTIASTVASADGGGTAILVTSGSRDLTIANGHIESGVTNNGGGVYSGSGFGYGIKATVPSFNILVSKVSVSGCLHDGISLPINNTTAAEGCCIKTAGGVGVSASINRNCVAMDCFGTAILGDQVADCRGVSSTGFGVFASSTAQNSFGTSTSADGVHSGNAVNCFGGSNGGIGVNCAVAINCQGFSSSSTGLQASYSATGCYGSSSSGTGIDAFIANVCHGNSSSGTPLTSSHTVNSF